MRFFWENKDIVVGGGGWGASSHLIDVFYNLPRTLRRKWDWELTFFRFGVKQPAPHPWQPTLLYTVKSAG